ncbi:MAG: isoleucine--tRNA ligase [Armatimonadetes bacterium]|nr:isoleucine--tRNA ligase [Armatimonadota bacterium]
MELKSTLNLPDAEFAIPMKADLPNLEPTIQKRWDEMSIYHHLQEARAEDPVFVLHDGPPYTNSPIHMGTAMNKILKDFVLKSRTMMGFRAPYVPGYDNHGLPIEQAVLQKFQEKKVSPTVIELRKACREHAAEYVALQSTQFQRLGVFGLWEKPYCTMDYRFEGEIIRTFKRLVEGGYVYKGLRPTLWSPTSRTALADTEIVYQDHVSKAIYVRFKLKEDPNRLFEKFANFYTVIWTTTPWTIPANLAVAFHPEFEYVVVKVGNDHYLLLEDLLPKVAEKVGWTNYSIEERIQGINMDRCVFQHPLWDRDSIAVMADYVTTSDGTGVVHTAPGHGRDDFYTGMKYGLEILCPVNEAGVMTHQAHEFEGIYYKKCDEAVVDKLKEVGALLAAEDYEHSYPYAERDGKPVIYRATEQWFVGIDHNDLRMKMLEQIKAVNWVPVTGQNRIHGMVLNRPDWCISRQRPWGVGIPVLYGTDSGEPVLDPALIELIAKMVEENGSDSWFEKTPEEFLPKGYAHPDTGETDFRKETDVLDVWFDSGATSFCVLEGNVEPRWKEHWPADLYLEGSDQHRGWFNSSLVIGTAIKGRAPYNEVVTHGFLVDESGHKMSKRGGNSVEPVAACAQYGADVIRYWVASVDYSNDAPCSDALLRNLGEHYRRVRNTIRFLMGNLSDFDENADPVELLPIDRWIVEETSLLVNDCVASYEAYDFNGVITEVHNFCVNVLSAFYLDVIKDRIYCERRNSSLRRSGQQACYIVLRQLNRLIAPILPHTAEEIRLKMNPDDGLKTVHEERFDMPTPEEIAELENSELRKQFDALLDVRGEAFAVFETWKGTDDVKDSQDAILNLQTDREEIFAFDAEDLATFLKVSEVRLTKGEPKYTFEKSMYLKCERSRLRRSDVTLDDGIALRKRDREIVEEFKGKV